MLWRPADRLERTFWLWRLRLTRVAALAPTSVATALSSVTLLLAHRWMVPATSRLVAPLAPRRQGELEAARRARRQLPVAQPAAPSERRVAAAAATLG